MDAILISVRNRSHSRTEVLAAEKGETVPPEQGFGGGRHSTSDLPVSGYLWPVQPLAATEKLMSSTGSGY